MSKLIKNFNSKIELQILKYVQGYARTPKEIETFFSDVPMLNDVLEKLQFKLYLKRDIKNYAAYKTYMINANLEKEIKEIESYKTVKTDEPKETVHYTFIDFKSFQKVYSIDGYDLAKEYVYNIAKEQFLRTENEIEDGEGEAEILENGNFFVSHNCMGNDFCCEALFEMTQKKQMVRLKVRKCYYTDEIKNQKHGFTNEFEPVIYQKQIQKNNNMKHQFVHMSKHRFDKVNLITTKKGDEYKCKDCGCNGFRDGLRPFIMVKKGKDMSFCPKAQYNRPVTVQLNESVCIQFGFEMNKIYTVVDSPDPKYKNDVWVFSEQRNEPVRLLDGDFLRVTDAPLATAKNDLVDELITDVFKRRDLDNKGTVQEHFNALKKALTVPTTVTDAPTATELPTVTDAPTATELPTVTDAPTATELPTVTDAPTTVTDEPLATTTPKGLIKYKSHEYQDGALLDYVHGIKAENGSFFTLCGIDADGGGSAFETEPLPNNAKIDCPFCKDEFEKSKIELMTQKKWFSQDEPKKTKEPKEKDDNMIKTALAETLKKVNTSNNDIMKLCHISKSELSEFKAEKRSTSLNRALEIVCNLNMTSQFLELLQILIKRKITAFTESKKVKKTGLHLKQLPLF